MWMLTAQGSHKLFHHVIIVHQVEKVHGIRVLDAIKFGLDAEGDQFPPVEGEHGAAKHTSVQSGFVLRYVVADDIHQLDPVPGAKEGVIAVQPAQAHIHRVHDTPIGAERFRRHSEPTPLDQHALVHA